MIYPHLSASMKECGFFYLSINNMKKIFMFIFVFLFLTGCSRPLLFKDTEILMDTFSEISCFSSDKNLALKAIDDAFEEIKRIERLFNRYDVESEISRINRLAGLKEIRINPEVFELIERSISYSKLSKGNFDITVVPLVDIWANGRKNNSMPDTEMIDSALEHVGYQNIILDKNNVSIRFLGKDVKIDLGGAAKGYAVDKAKEILSSRGIEDALVNIGGNISSLGKPPRKKSWQIGIQHPRDKNKITHTLSLDNRAVSTSGDYERFFMLDGKRFSHIIDPHNGRPSEGIISVTVVSDSAEKADFLSTAVFVMGIKNGLELVKSLESIEVFIFDKEGKLVKYP